MRPPRLRCTLFPLIYPPHLLVLPATLGLHLFWQTYPYFRALYVISVRRTKSLLTASFRFHLTMDTLAVLLYTSSLPRRVLDCQHFFRQIFLGYFSDIVQAFDTLRKNVCGDDYTSLHNPIVLSSVLPAYGMFHSIQILFL